MSEVELHTGILKEVNTRGLTVEEWIKRWVDNYLYNNDEDYYSRHRNDPDFDYKNAFYDLTWHNPYIIVGDKVFKIYDKNHESDFLCHINKTSDGNYAYVAQFYNGGTCLTEVLENELESIEK